MLHIVKHYSELAEVLRYLSESDAVILLEDAVYAALPEHKAHLLYKQARCIYCLLADVSARGLGNYITNHMVDYDGFVALTEEHATCITWE